MTSNAGEAVVAELCKSALGRGKGRREGEIVEEEVEEEERDPGREGGCPMLFKPLNAT